MKKEYTLLLLSGLMEKIKAMSAEEYEQYQKEAGLDEVVFDPIAEQV